MHHRSSAGIVRALIFPVLDSCKLVVKVDGSTCLQVGMSVSVFSQGREIATVCGGVCQHMDGGGGSWHAVDDRTLFMSYSVVKGVAATALATCVDAGECR